MNPAWAAEEEYGSFAVKGAEEADLIGIDVLNHACTASIQQKVNYIWLDRLCILQTNRDDKAWQISHMYQISKNCDPCLILPGGVRRLVSLDEETAWIHRAWTLQEATAPDTAKVLFSWRAGSGWFFGSSYTSGDLDEVIPSRTAAAVIMDLLLPYLGGEKFFTTDEDERDKRVKINPTLFGAAQSPVIALLGVMDAKDPDAVEHDIWRSGMMRTSSRPVDMVFSIMGLFGVTLNPRAFHKDDRVGATIALAQEILRRGGKATWLNTSVYLPPDKQISTFPQLPQTSVEGNALVDVGGRVRQITDVIGHEFVANWSLKEGVIGGYMDESGYLHLKRKAILLVPAKNREEVTSQTMNDCQCGTHKHVFMKAVDGTVWKVVESETTRELDGTEHDIQGTSPRVFAVYLGMALAHAWASTPDYLDTHSMRAMLIEEHALDRFHRRSNFVLCPCFEQLINT